jgi:hypothetical protein
VTPGGGHRSAGKFIAFMASIMALVKSKMNLDFCEVFLIKLVIESLTGDFVSRR